MLLIRNARLYTMEGPGLLEGGDVLIDSAKIAAVGVNLSASGAREIDARGAYVAPGFIDPHSHIGLWADGERDETGDGNEMTDRWTRSTPSIPALRRHAAPVLPPWPPAPAAPTCWAASFWP